jgi:hypothetical protein
VREVTEVRVAPWYAHGAVDPGWGLESELGEVDEVDEVSVGNDGCRRDGGTRATAMATG